MGQTLTAQSSKVCLTNWSRLLTVYLLHILIKSCFVLFVNWIQPPACHINQPSKCHFGWQLLLMRLFWQKLILWYQKLKRAFSVSPSRHFFVQVRRGKASRQRMKNKDEWQMHKEHWEQIWFSKYKNRSVCVPEYYWQNKMYRGISNRERIW